MYVSANLFPVQTETPHITRRVSSEQSLPLPVPEKLSGKCSPLCGCLLPGSWGQRSGPNIPQCQCTAQEPKQVGALGLCYTAIHALSQAVIVTSYVKGIFTPPLHHMRADAFL